MKAALVEASAGIAIPDRTTTHRLRHTYATTLVNAAMSLMGVMKLLGHRDYRMTLRYTEITLETVAKEYRAALTQLETRYRIALMGGENVVARAARSLAVAALQRGGVMEFPTKLKDEGLWRLGSASRARRTMMKRSSDLGRRTGVLRRRAAIRGSEGRNVTLWATSTLRTVLRREGHQAAPRTNRW